MIPEECNEIGKKFEIWLGFLLKHLGYENVRRNTRYVKRSNNAEPEKKLKREVDVSYDYINNGKIHLAIIEAKYSSDGNVRYKYDKEIERWLSEDKCFLVNNLVDDTWLKQMFVKADLSFLITNKAFERKVRREAKKYGIHVIEGNQLTETYKALGLDGTIDDSISSIDLSDYTTRYNTMYI